MTRYEIGFMRKMAENGVPAESAENLLKKYYGERVFGPPKYEDRYSDSSIPLEHKSSPTFLERNTWMLRPLVNALNKRFGNGATVAAVDWRF